MLKIKKIFSVTFDLIYQVILISLIWFGIMFLVGYFFFENDGGSLNNTYEYQDDLSLAKKKMAFLSKSQMRDVNYYREHKEELGDMYLEYLRAYSGVGGESSHYFGDRHRNRSSEVENLLDLYSLAEALQNNSDHWGSNLNDGKQKTSPYEEIPFILQDIKYMRDSYVNEAKETVLFYEERRYERLKAIFTIVTTLVCSIVLGRLFFVWSRRRENDEV